MRRYSCFLIALLLGAADSLSAQTFSVRDLFAQGDARRQDSTAMKDATRMRGLLGLPVRNGSATVVRVDTLRVAALERCPMPVATPDTTRLARLPVDRRDSSRVIAMPSARPACVNSFMPR